MRSRWQGYGNIHDGPFHTNDEFFDHKPNSSMARHYGTTGTRVGRMCYTLRRTCDHSMYACMSGCQSDNVKSTCGQLWWAPCLHKQTLVAQPPWDATGTTHTLRV